MLLPPMEKEGSFVPVMSLEYRPHREFKESCLKIRIWMVCQRRGTRLVGLGFRVESPEKYCQEDGKSGMHDFYHAQLLNEITQGISTSNWLPSTQPSFCLWATNPIDVLLNLVLTLYGLSYYREFFIELKTNVAMSDEFKELQSVYLES